MQVKLALPFLVYRLHTMVEQLSFATTEMGKKLSLTPGVASISLISIDIYFLKLFNHFSGNYKGDRPYVSGTPCSSCTSGYSCSGNLCVKGSDTSSSSGSGGSTSTDTENEQIPGEKTQHAFSLKQNIKDVITPTENFSLKTQSSIFFPTMLSIFIPS